MSDVDYIQYSFAAGEISPTLYGRVDLAKYRTGAELMRNFFVDYRGGATSRPGTEFVGRCITTNTRNRIVPFRFSTTQTNILEFGHEYMRVIENGAYVLEASKALSAITAADPAVFTSAGHGFSNDDWVYLDGIVGTMEELNGKTFLISNAATDTFELIDFDGVAVDTTGLVYTSGGTVARYFTLTTPYAAADLAMLKFSQAADTVTITHVDYAIRDLVRLGSANWTLNTVTIGTDTDTPANVAVAESPAGTGTAYTYGVTAVAADGDESLPGTDTITDAINITTTSGAMTVSWDAVTGADHYRIYRSVPATNGTTVPTGAMLGFIGRSTSTTFVDPNIAPDFSQSPPTGTDPFDSGNNPAVSGYFQQRKIYAASLDFPQTLWGSKPGLFKNFDAALPVNPGDAFEHTLISQELNIIKHMIAMPGGLVVLTGGGAWQLNGSGQGNSPITPINAVATPQAYNGCNDVSPIAINYDILYIQQKGSIVRDLAYNLFANVYTGTDLSVLSNHLFTGQEITEWTYAEEPYKIVWCVLASGRMLSLTFLKEQEVYGWAAHSTRGLVESIASVQEGLEDAVYIVVKRRVNGQWVKYVERFARREIEVAEDAWAVDCGLERPLTYPAATLTPVNGVQGDIVTMTASAAVWSSGDVGSVIRGGGGRATITAYTDSTHVQARINRPFTEVLPETTDPLDLDEGDWSCTAPVTTVTGLEHLEGEEVAILADGGVQPRKTVTGGSITLDHAASKIVVGLPFTAKLKTLAMDIGEPTVQGKRKQASEVTVRVNKSRGLKIGPDWDHLTEIKERNTQPYGLPIELVSADEHIVIDPLWQEKGSICAEQSNPLPASILASIISTTLGDNQ